MDMQTQFRQGLTQAVFGGIRAGLKLCHKIGDGLKLPVALAGKGVMARSKTRY